MRKRLLIITGVLGMALMTGCGSKQEDKKPVESVVETSTDSETSEVINETKEVKESDEVAVIEEDPMDYSVFKAPETISEEGEDGERVVMYGMLGELDDSGFYEVYTSNGMFVFRINDDTIVEDVELSSGTYVEVINTGVVTMSLPGQIANVLELKIVNAEDVVAEGRSIDELFNKTVDQEVSDEAELVEGSEVDKTYPEVEYDGNNATFYGEVKEITEEDEDTISYLVDTANGTKKFIVSKELVSEDIQEGSNIKAVTDGIETRSIPGILSGVSSFELME